MHIHLCLLTSVNELIGYVSHILAVTVVGVQVDVKTKILNELNLSPLGSAGSSRPHHHLFIQIFTKSSVATKYKYLSVYIPSI